MDGGNRVVAGNMPHGSTLSSFVGMTIFEEWIYIMYMYPTDRTDKVFDRVIEKVKQSDWSDRTILATSSEENTEWSNNIQVVHPSLQPSGM